MNIDVLDVIETENMGKTVVARCFIPQGTILGWCCDKCEVCTIDHIMEKTNSDYYQKYCFVREDQKRVLTCGVFRYLNHSCDANLVPLSISDLNFDILIKDIEKGEEITYDYRFFSDYDEYMECLCGKENCCKIVTNSKEVKDSVINQYSKKIEMVLSNYGKLIHKQY